MRKRCEEAIDSVEKFNNNNGYLPSSLQQADFYNESGSNEIFYEVLSDSSYVISYMYSIDYNMFYYSDTKKWQTGMRQ